MAFDKFSSDIAPVEAAVLGGILYASEASDNNNVFDRIAEEVTAADFHFTENLAIWRSMQALSDANIVVRPMAVLEHINSTGAWTSDRNKNEYLGEIYEYAPVGRELIDYSRLLSRQGAKRRLALAGETIKALGEQAGHDGTSSQLYEEARVLLDEAESLKKDTGSWVSAAEAVEIELGELETVLNNGKPVGLSTGSSKFDAKIGGLHRGDLYVFAGASSMGKTALAVNVCDGAARTEGARVCLFSQEMSRQQLAYRMASAAARRAGNGAIAYQNMRNGTLGQSELARLKDGAKLIPKTYYWNTARGLTFQDIRSHVRKAKRQLGGIDIICIDYLQILSIQTGRNQTRAEAIGNVTMGLKKLAGEEDCVVILLSQLKRIDQREDKRPQLSDLRESGSIEQDADTVIFAYREEYYLERKEPPWEPRERHAEWMAELGAVRNQLDLIVGKQRMGSIGTVRVHFEKETDVIIDDEALLHEEDLF